MKRTRAGVAGEDFNNDHSLEVIFGVYDSFGNGKGDAERRQSRARLRRRDMKEWLCRRRGRVERICVPPAINRQLSFGVLQGTPSHKMARSGAPAASQ